MEARCHVGPADDRATIAQKWRLLEQKAHPSFFLSWTWISCWLESLSRPPLLVEVAKGGDTAALGLFSSAVARRHLILRRRQLHLHQSGDPDLDRIAVEFNGLLLREEDAAQMVPLALSHLRALAWDECILPGVPPAYAAYAARAGYICATERRSPDFAVDLQALRQDGIELIDTLSANSRGQLRRARRLAAEHGALSLHPAETAEQALQFFRELVALDRSRRGSTGAFATSARLRFHQRLIAAAVPRGEVELLQARAGDRILGYLYLFCHRRRVSVYQLGYPAPADNRHRPGLVMHDLAIARAKAQGHAGYDFLAGEARYKRSLGRETGTLVWLRLQRPGMTASLERGARGLKGLLRPKPATGPAA